MQPYPPVVTNLGYAPPQAPVERELPFRFTGTAQEYFRIWIVNTLLTIVTLGVYSAWAKVRTKQYFYRNTWVDDSSFEYLADPIKVLKGRIIAAVALGLLFGSQHYSPTLYFVVVGILVLASPWVLVKALAFNARNSAYRNIRLAFTGRVGEAAGLYLGMVLFYIVTCGMAYPYVQWRITSFAVTRHLYGDQRLWWVTKAGGYYRAYLVVVLLALPGYAVLASLMIASVKGAGGPTAMKSAMLPILGVFYAYLLIPGAFLRARLANLLYGGLRIGQHELASNQRGFELLKLYFVNLLAMVVSLGLLIPWAKIRLAKYRVSCLTLHAQGPLHAERLLDDDASAVGEGLSDLGDFDIGIGV
jgi:uncharacterized membrane protein YjgN (DUF898 family)